MFTGISLFCFLGCSVINRLSGNILDMTTPEPVSQELFDLYLNRVQQYSVASGQISEGSEALWPRMQVRGLYIELALKTYRAVFGDLRKGHDLEKFARRCERDGLQLTEGDINDIIKKVNKPYYEHKGWRAKFLCRYPSENQSLIAWNLPMHKKTQEMVERIIDQAKQRYAKARA